MNISAGEPAEMFCLVRHKSNLCVSSNAPESTAKKRAGKISPAHSLEITLQRVLLNLVHIDHELDFLTRPH